MKIKMGTLRRLISESAPKDPQLAALPETIRLQHRTADGSIRVVQGNRDRINIALAKAGASKELRLAFMMGQKVMNDAVVAELQRAGALESGGAPRQVPVAAAPPSPRPAAAPGAASPASASTGVGRMTPERAQEWLDYYVRQFVRVTLKGGARPADAAEAAELADSFLTVEPRATKLVGRMGLSPDDLTALIADRLMDGLTNLDARAQVAADRAAATPRSSKETYKIYPGGKRWGSPVVTRVKGKVFKGPMDSQFKPGEQAAVAPDGDRLRVKKTDSDHTQTWEPE